MLLLGILSRSTKAEATKGVILRAIVLVGIAIIRRLSLVRSPVILEEGLKIKFTNIKAFSNNLIKKWLLRRISIRDNFDSGGLLFCSGVPQKSTPGLISPPFLTHLSTI